MPDFAEIDDPQRTAAEFGLLSLKDGKPTISGLSITTVKRNEMVMINSRYRILLEKCINVPQKNMKDRQPPFDNVKN
uniref:Uncharacterized protein n=1 Tax=Romanomermis culicivorax TaxID=13658 RepID=A0A915HHX3_ROMCU